MMEGDEAAVPDYAGQLELVIVSAHGLAVRENKADPYVTLDVVSPLRPRLPEHHGKTRVLKRNTSPEWNESFTFDFGSAASRHHSLRLEVWDMNTIMRDKLLGQAQLSLAPGERVQEGIETELELPLGQGEKEQCGAVRIKAKLVIDYHRQRDERAEAQAKRAREQKEKWEKEQKEQKEKESKLIEQVRLTASTAEALIAAFKKVAGGSKSIDANEFHRVFDSLESTSKNAVMEDISDTYVLFDCLDINHDGRLDLEEVLFGLSTFSTGTLDDKAELIFKAMDKDNSGSLDRDEVKVQFERLLRAFCTYLKHTVQTNTYKKCHKTLPHDQLNAIINARIDPLRAKLMTEGLSGLFAQGDKDRDGRLTLDEWRAIVKQNEVAEWLVRPESYVRKLAPKIEKALRRV